jgi:hypothetical protein
MIFVGGYPQRRRYSGEAFAIFSSSYASSDSPIGGHLHQLVGEQHRPPISTRLGGGFSSVSHSECVSCKSWGCFIH